MDGKKLKKRKEIAKSCCALFYEKGYNNISVSALAKNAGIAKGSIYEYFSCKEDIILELMCCLQEEYDKKIEFELDSKKSIEQNLKIIFQIFLNNSKDMLIKRDIFKQFLILTIVTDNDSLKEYYKHFREKYINLVDKFVKNKDTSINIFDNVIAYFLNSLLIDKNFKNKLLSLIELLLKKI